MGNTYNITKCPRCNCVFEADTVMVHRAENSIKIMEMLRSGMSIAAAREHFCPYCGGYQEEPNSCDCSVAYRAAKQERIATGGGRSRATKKPGS